MMRRQRKMTIKPTAIKTPSLRRYAAFPVLALAVGCSTLAFGADDDPHFWLDRMAKAVEYMNYEGVFIHMHNGEMESMEVVHRYQDNKVGERITALDGAGREIIRNENEVMCIFPDKRTVLVEPRKDQSPLLSTLPSYSEDLNSYYEFLMHKKTRVAGRPTQVLVVKPRDGFRYGFKLWLDTATAMPLKSQLRNEQGEVVEQILFAEITLPQTIADSALKARIKTENFRWVRQAPQARAAESRGKVMWRAARVPRGFQLSVTHRQVMAGSESPVDHLVYTDGLASVSVFVEALDSDAEPDEGWSKIGAANAFSTRISGRVVTAVGEVPAHTVKAIANSVREDRHE